MLNKIKLINIFQKLLDEAKNSYDEFNTADGKIGDGDLGVTILHGLEEVNNNIDKFSDDMGANFILCSQAFVKKSGSSFGTLIAFSFMNISKNLKGKSECNHEDILSIFEISLKTILERGKTNLGDKTIADSLDLIIKNLKIIKITLKFLNHQQNKLWIILKARKLKLDEQECLKTKLRI